MDEKPLERIQAADEAWFQEDKDGCHHHRDEAVKLFRDGDDGNMNSHRRDDGGTAEARNDGSAAPCQEGNCCQKRPIVNGLKQNQVNHTKKRVCVIGAGPSGLITVKELLEASQDAVCHEQSNRVGGVFGNAWEGATMTSSNLLTSFGCYPLHLYSQETGASKNVVTMWTCPEYCNYLEAFVKHFSLQPYIQFGTRVVFIRRHRDNTRWNVGVQKIDGDNSSAMVIETFDAVAVCSGMHQRPNIPSWCQELYRRTKPGHKKQRKLDFVHSSQVVSGSDYKDKNVVLIGLGESGSDLALLVAPHAARLTLSVRTNGSGHVLSRYTNEEVSDLNTSRGYGGGEAWSQADHDKFAQLVRNAVESNNEKTLRNLARCYLGTDSFTALDLMAIEWNARYRNAPYNRYGTKNFGFLEALRSYGAKVVGDITSVNDLPQDTDVIILCTGYIGVFPFFEQHLPELNERSSRHRDRYHHMIDLQIGVSLAFIGFSRPAFGAVPPLSEMSARYWVLLLTGERVLGEDASEVRDKDRSYEERLFRRDATRIQSLVQYHRMMHALAKCIDCGPPLQDLQRNHPRVYARVVHSCLSASQFRLVGAGSTEEAWTAVLESPLPRYSRQPRSAFHLKLKAGMFD